MARHTVATVLLFFGLATVTASEPTDEPGRLCPRHPQAVPRMECFPIERLPDEERHLSETILLRALDREALFTLVGGVKPVSDGFWSRWAVDRDRSEVASVRNALAAWTCGDAYAAGTLAFSVSDQGKRYTSAWVARRPALKACIRRHRADFAHMGLTPDSPPREVMAAIESAEQPGDRWRGFGRVFGYPEHAIDFFTAAGLHQRETGEFVERDFRQVPVFRADTGRFVYAVPEGAAERDEDRRLREEAGPILAYFRALRPRYVGEGKPGAVELLRDWFDDGTGWCHPAHALVKVKPWAAARAWVADNAVPLRTAEPESGVDDMRALADLIGTARIVAMGESTHGSREMFRLKHRMFEYLVQEHGFRMFGIEASFAACLPIDRYVQTGVGDPRAAVAGQGFWTWDTQEMLDLVEWMRRHNASAERPEDRVHFYGFDTQDACTPLRVALDHLSRADPAAASGLADRLRAATGRRYSPALHNSGGAQIARLRHAVADLGAKLDAHEQQLIRSTTPRDHRVARRCVWAADKALGQIAADLCHWSSIGQSAEVALYTRLDTAVARLTTLLPRGGAAGPDTVRSLLEQLRSEEQRKAFFLDYRDQASESQRLAWDQVAEGLRTAVQGARTGYPGGLRQARKDAADVRLVLKVYREYLAKPKELCNPRDQSMAEMAGWILDEHGPQSRMMLWAHNWHVAKARPDPHRAVPRMGTFLEKAYGDDYLPTGFAFGRGSFQARPPRAAKGDKPAVKKFAVGPAAPNSVDGLFSQAGPKVFAVDLRRLPDAGPATTWFRSERPHRDIGAVFSADGEKAAYARVVLPEHFEAMFFLTRTTRAHPLAPASVPSAGETSEHGSE